MSRVLVIHPYGTVVRPILQTLSAFGYAVDYAPSGQSAIELFTTRSYGVAFFAEALPDMDGTDCFLKLRRQYGHLQGVLLSTAANVNTVFDAARAGIAKVLADPVDPSDILPALVDVGVSRVPMGLASLSATTPLADPLSLATEALATESLTPASSATEITVTTSRGAALRTA